MRSINDALAAPNQRISGLEDKLQASPTAYQHGVQPSGADISTEKSLEAAKASKAIANRKYMQQLWYGTKTAATAPKVGEEQAPPGFWSKALKFLGAPVAAESAVVASAIGKGVKPTVLENIKSNIETGGNFGDVLRSTGLPNYVSMPLGMSLDIAMDPFNWASVGDAALVPRIATGLTKGGVEGAVAGAKSGVLNKISGVLSGLKPLGGDFAKYNVAIHSSEPLAGKIPVWMQKVAEGSTEQSRLYDEAAHKGMDFLTRFEGANREAAVDKIISKAGKMIGKPDLKLGTYGYNPLAESADIRTAEKAAEVARQQNLVIPEQGFKGTGGNFNIVALTEKLKSEAILSGRAEPRIRDSLDRLVKLVTEGNDALRKRAVETAWNDIASDYLKGDPQVVTRLNAAILDGKKTFDPESFITAFDTFKTENDLWNKKLALLLTHSGALKTLTAYNKFVTAFKVGNVGWSAVSRLNSVVGNVAMTAMAGLDILNPSFMSAMNQARKFVFGGDTTVLRDVFGSHNLDWSEFIKKDPNFFRQTLGIDPRFALGGTDYIDNAIKQIMEHARKANVPEEELAALQTYFNSEMGKFSEALASSKDVKKAISTTIMGLEPTGPLDPDAVRQLSTNAHAQEMLFGIGAKWIRDLKREATAGKGMKSVGANLLHKYLTVGMEDYGKYDQAFKLGTAIHLTKNGIGEDELRVLQKWFKFDPNLIQKSKYGNRYILKPEAALDVANEIYLNYQAMPGFIKVMRNLPIVGMPFLSFQYGMTSNVAKALGYNPAFFNKANFFIREMSGRIDPLEKEQLDSKYYNYLKGPEYMKLPFFKQNPIYLNMGQMFPHLSLNFLQTQERTFGDTWGDKAATIIDQMPIFKDPAGQVLLNYVIMPMLLGKAINSFGQALYPETSTPLEKVGFAASDIANIILPRTPTAAIGLIPNLPVVGNERVLPFMPYKFRSTQYPMNTGANSQGVPPFEKETMTFNKVRAVLRELGIPITRVVKKTF